jgi:DNA-binding response OmpR family regulator
MKLLVAINFASTEKSVLKALSKSGIKRKDVCFVTTIDDFLEALETGRYDFIVSEYCINGADIWQIAKLVNSTKYAAHWMPTFLIQDSCETEIPPILAKEFRFQILPLGNLGEILTAVHEANQKTGDGRCCIDALKNKLLVIDDDDDATFFAFHALKDDYEVDIAYDGLSGYQCWESKRHELILLDLMLPGMMGDLVLEKIMEIDPNQPVIIITGHDQPNNHRELLLNGASEYLCKPFTMTDLNDRCLVILNRAKLIYQAHYLTTKLEKMGNLLWLLDQTISSHDIQGAEYIMATIKVNVPVSNLSDDQKLRLVNNNFSN